MMKTVPYCKKLESNVKANVQKLLLANHETNKNFLFVFTCVVTADSKSGINHLKQTPTKNKRIHYCINQSCSHIWFPVIVRPAAVKIIHFQFPGEREGRNRKAE